MNREELFEALCKKGIAKVSVMGHRSECVDGTTFECSLPRSRDIFKFSEITLDGNAKIFRLSVPEMKILSAQQFSPTSKDELITPMQDGDAEVLCDRLMEKMLAEAHSVEFRNYSCKSRVPTWLDKADLASRFFGGARGVER